jgi:hypothetical protein
VNPVDQIAIVGREKVLDGQFHMAVHKVGLPQRVNALFARVYDIVCKWEDRIESRNPPRPIKGDAQCLMN